MRARSIVAPLILIAATAACGSVAQSDSPKDDPKPNNEEPTAVASSKPVTSARGEVSVPAPDSRTRWLAYSTWVSTSSPQRLLHLIDLKHPELPPIEVEREHALAITYSPDGHWLFYQAYRSESESHLYLIDVSGEKPSQPKLLFKAVHGRPCAWSPDSTKLACVKESATSSAVIYFDIANAGAPEVVVGPFASNVHPLDSLFWSDKDTLIFPNDGTLTKVKWSGGVVEATPFGAPGGVILRLSPDGQRALVTGVRDYDQIYLGDQDPSFRIVDLQSGTSLPLDSHRSWSFSESLDAAVAIDDNARSYYRTSGNPIVKVSTVVVAGTPQAWSREWQHSPYRELWLGSRLIETRNGRPVLVTIGEHVVSEEAVPGDFTNVQSVRPSPDGTLLYIGTAVLDDQKRPIDATATHWLSRVVDGHPQSAAQFASGYATDGLASISFAPSSRKLLLHGSHRFDETPDVAAAFGIYDLSGPTIQERRLDLQLKWASTEWATDSSYLAFVGALTLKERTSFVVDVADEQKAVRKLFTCNTNSAPLPGCPLGATF